MRLLDRLQEELSLTREATVERRLDARGLGGSDPRCDAVVDSGIDWLCTAQDQSASQDGGVARDYSLLRGWASSYPETTGYIVPTMLDGARLRDNEDLRRRARRMLDWLVSIQFPEGGFQGGKVDASPRVPVTFNTGQILLGLAAGEKELGGYRESLIRAADWLVETQDPDGCWRRHPTPFAAPGEKVYETHVAWGLVEAERIVPGRGFVEAAVNQVRWALTKQRSNGWFEDCCLTDPHRPLTHTLAYALRGILEVYRFTNEVSWLEAARRTADGLMSAMREDGYLSGRLDADWRPAVKWVCLTGTAQIAHCFLLLFELTGDRRYLDAGKRANSYVRRTVKTEGPVQTRGGVKGSFPVNGGYGKYEYLNWAVKFTVDANLLERSFE